MPSNYSLLIMYVRFGLASTLLACCTTLATVATLLLPKAHPSRIYYRGRIQTARAIRRCALSRDAARGK